jgi:hypothetical protein
VAVEIGADVRLRAKTVDHERDTQKGRDFKERFVEDGVIARNVDLPETTWFFIACESYALDQITCV